MDIPTRQPRRASIWAQDRAGVIGDGKGMLWHVPEDFKHFRSETMGCPVVMGRASFEALGSPLPGRLNIVLTRSPEAANNVRAAGALASDSLDEALRLADEECARTGAATVWITGGARVYQEALPLVDELVVTELDLSVGPSNGAPGHVVRAPEIDPVLWRVVPERSDAQWRPRSGDAPWKVVVYERRNAAANSSASV